MGTICASVGVRVRVCTCALPLRMSVQGMVCTFVTRQGYTRSVEPGASRVRTDTGLSSEDLRAHSRLFAGRVAGRGPGAGVLGGSGEALLCLTPECQSWFRVSGCVCASLGLHVLGPYQRVWVFRYVSPHPCRVCVCAAQCGSPSGPSNPQSWLSSTPRSALIPHPWTRPQVRPGPPELPCRLRKGPRALVSPRGPSFLSLDVVCSCVDQVEGWAAWSAGSASDIRPETHPLTGMDLVGTNVFCRGSCSRSELLIFVTSQGCRGCALVSVSQENLQEHLASLGAAAQTCGLALACLELSTFQALL